MSDRVVKASTFKAKCLSLLDLVASSGQTILVTKRGKPVARLVPLDDDQTGGSLRGSVDFRDSTDEDLFSTGQTWDADTGRR